MLTDIANKVHLRPSWAMWSRESKEARSNRKVLSLWSSATHLSLRSSHYVPPFVKECAEMAWRFSLFGFTKEGVLQAK